MEGVQLGLCCLNTQLRGQKPPIFASRSSPLKTVVEKGINALKAKVRQNLEDVLTMMDWNHDHGIHVFRLSSELFPHMSNPRLPPEQRAAYTYDFARDLLEAIGAKSRQLRMRLTFHPGQFNVVGTPNVSAFRQTVLDLTYHATVLDLMGCDEHSVMVVHGGGVYGDKTATITRWVKQFHDLPLHVQRRLVLENCEHSFSVEDCLAISAEVNVPVVFDTHHHECFKSAHPEADLKEGTAYMERVLATWQRRGIKPKFHVSEQGAGRLGHHSDFIETIPGYLLEIPARYGVEIDIMIEAKMKEQAIFKLYDKYGVRKRKRNE
jgi:UV DNA damage endonuclease